MNFSESVRVMTGALCTILAPEEPSIYLYGSVALDDFHLGWSDIDILCLCDYDSARANRLVGLRRELLEREPDNRYYRSFEGGILPLESFLSNAPARAVYWGTSGQRIDESYLFDCFSRAELLSHGILLFGQDVRGLMRAPTEDELRQGVKRHLEAALKYGERTKGLYAYGWLLDISRGLYTIKTGKVIAKTEAGRWALNNGLCPVPEALQAAVRARESPERYAENVPPLGAEISKYAIEALKLL